MPFDPPPVLKGGRDSGPFQPPAMLRSLAHHSVAVAIGHAALLPAVRPPFAPYPFAERQELPQTRAFPDILGQGRHRQSGGVVYKLINNDGKGNIP
jgi:hypothetical protein